LTTDAPIKLAALSVVMDASVLYSIRATNLMLEAASHHLFRPQWTDDIHAEWTRSVLARRPGADPASIAKRCNDMDTYFPDACVDHYQPIIAGLDLPDPDDRHVLAAAIFCEAPLIVTFNLRHFPSTALAPKGVRAVHPDAFLINLLDQHPDAMIQSAKAVRRRLNAPPQSPDEFLAALAKAKLTGFATALRLMTGQF
jgi:PIN domain